ncbi:MAG: outer membrane protein assembly factor BamD [Candidatus Liberibacter europaeus]|uniref:Outer membrane protein assembly factor BamD n=1 Tax=Candidatus Liberibacter europaeus TaxID=744859 RepID=A0A2T4VYD8_9HYPH|nr:outer membrane protein assembly factor BamD [Candidatus Liberibacter europaeus]PTL86784.1 MAG: outer membrane protein assembly factor BamD [Candidatus Liberibacter europaeus]
MYKFSFTLFFIIIISALVSCKHNIDISKVGISSDSQELIYDNGIEYLQNKRFREAYTKLHELVENFPFSKGARKALLMSAFAKYRSGQYAEAVSIGKSYLEQYPRHSNNDYVYYLVGLSYANMINNVYYDQRFTILMIENMDNIVKNYPGSPYADKARLYVRLGKNQLAAKEMYLGRYYLKSKEIVSAILRFQYVIKYYYDTEQIEEALARLVEAYLLIGLVEDSWDILYVLQKNYPRGFWCQYVEQLMRSNTGQ